MEIRGNMKMEKENLILFPLSGFSPILRSAFQPRCCTILFVTRECLPDLEKRLLHEAAQGIKSDTQDIA
jgi:hypothetical protein